MLPEEHRKWIEDTNSRLDFIYKLLCEHENEFKEEEEEFKILDLIATINDIHHTAKSIHPVTETLQKSQQDLCEQMKMLQNSLDLLKLETKTKGVEINQEE